MVQRMAMQISTTIQSLVLFVLLTTHYQIDAAQQITYEQNDILCCNPKRIDRTTQEIVEPCMIVLNYTCQPTALESAMSLRRGRASAHYMIDTDGTIYELLHNMPQTATTMDADYLRQRAWHAGHGYWKTERKEISDINSHSIGIVFVNQGANPKDNPDVLTTNLDNQTRWFEFTQEQQKACINLCRQLINHYHIDLKDIVGHGEVAINPTTKSLGRKIGPGPRFPWQDLAEQGVSVHHYLTTEELNQPCNVEVIDLQRTLQRWGYSVQISQEEDAQTSQAVIQAQIHYDQTHIDGNCRSQRLYRIMQALLAQRYAIIQAESDNQVAGDDAK